MPGAWSFAFWYISNIEHLLHHTRPEHSKTPLHTSKPHKHTYTSPICSQSPPPGVSGQFRTTTDTNRNQQTPDDTNRRTQAPQKAVQGSVAAPVDIEWHLLESVGVFWCLTASFSVLWCLEMWGGCLASFWKGIWVLVMDVFKVWVPPREHLSVQALYGATNASYWKCFKRQNSTHLTPLKHQNTKTFLYKLSKNSLGYCTSWNFWVRQKKITIYSL